MADSVTPVKRITQDTFDQIARYNIVFKVKYLVVTNGLNHFCCVMDYTDNSYKYLETIPMYQESCFSTKTYLNCNIIGYFNYGKLEEIFIYAACIFNTSDSHFYNNSFLKIVS